jgi:hypothetical protein
MQWLPHGRRSLTATGGLTRPPRNQTLRRNRPPLAAVADARAVLERAESSSNYQLDALVDALNAFDGKKKRTSITPP